MTDFVMTKNQDFIENKKVDVINHGSGCNYSASMIFSLAQGKSILESAKFAQKFTFDSIRGAQKVGKGLAITHKKSDFRYFELILLFERNSASNLFGVMTVAMGIKYFLKSSTADF